MEAGYKNWKRATEKMRGFSQHSRSQDHLFNMTKWESYKSLPKISNKDEKYNVATQISEAHRTYILVSENRAYLRIVAQTVLFTAIQPIQIQGIAQRGHDESAESLNRGNFLEILNRSLQRIMTL